jgi:nucleotide-binding universal stress UspA family protein
MKYNNIIVPVNGEETDEMAIQTACFLAESTKSKINCYYIIVVNWNLPVDAVIESEMDIADHILDFAECIANERGFGIRTDVLQAREPGLAIVEESIELQADLIIMGIKRKQSLGVFNLGSVVPYLMKHAPCPLLLCQM